MMSIKVAPITKKGIKQHNWFDTEEEQITK